MAYLMKMDKIDDKLYDMKLVTVSGYAVMAELSPSMYESIKTDMQLNDNPGQNIPIMLFKEELEKSIESQLQAHGLTAEESEIADLTFGFNNKKILKLLTQRAAALKASKFKIARDFEKKITEEKNKNFDRIVRPNSFFCTFRHEVGQHKAI